MDWDILISHIVLQKMLNFTINSPWLKCLISWSLVDFKSHYQNELLIGMKNNEFSVDYALFSCGISQMHSLIMHSKSFLIFGISFYSSFLLESSLKFKELFLKPRAWDLFSIFQVEVEQIIKDESINRVWIVGSFLWIHPHLSFLRNKYETTHKQSLFQAINVKDLLFLTYFFCCCSVVLKHGSLIVIRLIQGLSKLY